MITGPALVWTYLRMDFLSLWQSYTVCLECKETESSVSKAGVCVAMWTWKMRPGVGITKFMDYR